jgi:hypothetical protein
VSKWLLAPKPKKADVPKLESTIHSRIWPKGFGTIAFRDAWDILTRSWFLNLIQPDYSVIGSGSRNLQQVFLIQTTGQYKGYPLRHSNTEIGFSDHFPVYIYLIKEK